MRVGLAFLVATALLSFTAGSKQQLSGAVIEHLRSRGLSPPITMDKDQVGDKGEESREGGKGQRERGVKQHHCCGISTPFSVVGITRNIPASIVYFLGIVSDFTCHLLSPCASGDPHNLDNTMRNNTNWRRSSGSASIMMVTLASTCLPRMHACSGTR